MTSSTSVLSFDELAAHVPTWKSLLVPKKKKKSDLRVRQNVMLLEETGKTRVICVKFWIN